MGKISIVSMAVAATLAATGFGAAAQGNTIVFQQDFQMTAATLGYVASYGPGQGVTFTVTDLGTPTDTVGTSKYGNGVNNTFTGYTAYLLSATTNTSNDNNWIIGGLEMGGVPNESAGDGLHGTFLQEWTSGRAGTTPTPYESTTSSGSYYSGDTHWTQQPGAAMNPAEAGLPSENAITPVTIPNFDSAGGYLVTGTDTTLLTTYSIPVAYQSDSIDIAYMVIPTGTPVTFAGLVSTVNPTATYATLITFSGSINATAVPEPTALALMAIAGMGILTLGRKRKRA